MKYRVWNNATKRFLRTSTYIDSDGNLYKDNDPHGLDMSGKRSISPMTNCTVMRSTGLHDKNGKEIYEGDILSEAGYPFEVIWDVSRAKFRLQCRGKSIQYPEWNRGIEMEIIGNIFQDKHLLS